MQNSDRFVNNLLNWYNSYKRELPWRETSDPYIIWLSEVILQQTRVKQGLPYFHRFLENFPNVEALASANEEEILRLWQGLGYYSRAKNLHACAKNIMENYSGKFPNSPESLLSLKGIGKYTASAIASFAFDKKVAVVEGNVYRVLSRVFGLYDDIASPKGQKTFQELATYILPKVQTATYNQAIMEFGALQCTPGMPDCNACVCRNFCFAANNKAQRSLPVKTKKVKVKTRYFNYFVIRNNGLFYMKKREKKDIWNGLYDFYLVETLQEAELDSLENEELKALKRGDVVINDNAASYKHVLTHQRLYAKFFLVDLPNKSDLMELFNKSGLNRYTLEEIKELPKPILIDNYLSKNFF